MASYYKNSIVIDFTVVPVRPKLERVRDFVFDQMGIDVSQIKNIQTRIIKAQVIIEVETQVLAEQLVNEHNLKHSVEHDGVLYQIPIDTADNIKEVRVFELPCQMPNSIIAKFLSTFGEVISMKNEKWRDVFTGFTNGTRIVRMKLRKQIPSFAKVSGCAAYITYNGQTRTCKYCNFPLHIGKACGENRKDLVEGGITAAQILQFPSLEQPMSPQAGGSGLGGPSANSGNEQNNAAAMPPQQGRPELGGPSAENDSSSAGTSSGAAHSGTPAGSESSPTAQPHLANPSVPTELNNQTDSTVMDEPPARPPVPASEEAVVEDAIESSKQTDHETNNNNATSQTGTNSNQATNDNEQASSATGNEQQSLQMDTEDTDSLLNESEGESNEQQDHQRSSSTTRQTRSQGGSSGSSLEKSASTSTNKRRGSPKQGGSKRKNHKRKS